MTKITLLLSPLFIYISSSSPSPPSPFLIQPLFSRPTESASTRDRVIISCKCTGACATNRCRCFKEKKKCSVHCHDSAEHDCGYLASLALRTEIALIEKEKQGLVRGTRLNTCTWCPLRTCSYSESICRAKIESVEMYKGLWLWRSRDGLLFDFCARGRRVRIARKAEISRPQTPRIQHHNHRYEREQKWTVGKEQKDCYSISIPWSGLNLG